MTEYAPERAEKARIQLRRGGKDKPLFQETSRRRGRGI